MSKLSKALRELAPNESDSRSAWDAVMRQGVIASLHIGRHRFQQQLDLEDIGVRSRNTKEQRALEAMVQAGVKRLLPAEYSRAFDTIESSARHTLSRGTHNLHEGRIYAFATPFGSFIPVTAFTAWKAKIEEYRERYMAKAAELIANYDDVRKGVLSDYYSIATGTYERLRRFNPELLNGQSAATFVRNYRDRIREGFPTQADAEASFYFKTSLTLLTLPEDLREKIATSTILSEEEKARVRQLQFMRNEVNREMLADLRTFTATVDEQLYRLVYEVASDAQKAITKNKTMRAKTVVMLRNLVEQVRSLNFTDHKDLATLTEGIEESVSNYVTRQDKTAARQHLVGALDAARVMADRRLGQIGVVDRRHRSLVEDGAQYDVTRRGRREASDDSVKGIEVQRRRTRAIVE